MPLRYDYIKDLNEQDMNNLKKAFFDTSNPLYTLPLSVNSISPDGSDWLHVVEASKTHFKHSHSPKISLRVIIKNHGGTNIYIPCSSDEMQQKYRNLRFLVRNTDYVRITLQDLRITSVHNRNNLLLFARDFKIKRSDAESPLPELLI